MIGDHRESTAPDLMHPVIGYRLWDLEYLRRAPLADRWRLSSPFSGGHWPVGGPPTPSRCISLPQRSQHEDAHESPHPDCRCGWYSYHAREVAERLLGEMQARSEIPLVIGVCRCWGRIEVHRDGIRSEYATVAALVVPDPETLSNMVRWDFGRAFADGEVPPLVPDRREFAESLLAPRRSERRVRGRLGAWAERVGIDIVDAPEELDRYGRPTPEHLRPSARR